MVRVPELFGDGGNHHESEGTAQVKEEPGEEVPTVVGSPSASLNARSTDRQSPGRSSVDRKEVSLATESELNPPPPPQVPSGTPADRNASSDPPGEDSTAKAVGYSATTTTAQISGGKMSKSTKTAWKKLKAPVSDVEENPSGRRPNRRFRIAGSLLRTSSGKTT
ncbi:hypothetical protein P3T76_011837 [Phytophthora citrophthora]|uniref:Uncharacterized protein n=1 Tax=Phytophthora citrophthora TaxID=4793 RepID=A0AAD9LEL2_9STRA|nr:hypothetical protein P3T76_011837 [Phytophthora citrophthora]